MKNVSTKNLVALAACVPSIVSGGSSYRPPERRPGPAFMKLNDIPRGGASDKKEDEDNHKFSKKKKPSPKKKKRHRSKDNKEEPPSPAQAANPVVEEILEQSCFYKILGVSRSATEVEIKKAYRKRAVHVHPDKTGGDRRAFDKVSESHDVLSDENKRQLYNKFGKEGVENGGAAGAAGSYQDIFRSMFQQQQSGYGRSRQNFTMRYQIEVSLEDMYNGVTQDVVVTPPHGAGRKQKKISVDIPKGALPGQAIILSGEMDFSSDASPGDLVFVVNQAPHPVFTRKGHDLAMEMVISLEEAICGIQRDFRHLDGSIAWVESALSEDETPVIIQTGDVQVIKGRGMPKKGSNNEFGDLYIQFRVEMPKPSDSKASSLLNKEELAELSRLLAKLYGDKKKKPLPSPEDETPVYSLQTALPTNFGRASGRVQLEEDEQFHESSPFASQFFSQGNGRGGFYFGGNFGGGHPFGGDPYGGDEDGNVECNQM